MTASRCALVLALLLLAGRAIAQPAAFTTTTETAELSGAPARVDVYRPEEAGSARIAVLAHGFSRDRSRARDLGGDLARVGIIAVAPDLPSLVDYWSNAGAVMDVVRELEHGAFGLPPVPRSRIVLIGTSAGGVATLIAASKLPGLAGWIGLDPVDRSGVARYAAARMTVPAVVLLGDFSLCNLFGSGRSIAESIPTLMRAERVRGASHCDFEGPTNPFCRNVCGGSSPRMAVVVRDHVVEAAREMYDNASGGTAFEEAAPNAGAP